MPVTGTRLYDAASFVYRSGIVIWDDDTENILVNVNATGQISLPQGPCQWFKTKVADDSVLVLERFDETAARILKEQNVADCTLHAYLSNELETRQPGISNRPRFSTFAMETDVDATESIKITSWYLGRYQVEAGSSHLIRQRGEIWQTKEMTKDAVLQELPPNEVLILRTASRIRARLELYD